MLLIMECILEANPGPEIRWFRGETAIEETTPRYKMTRKKTARDQYTLTLTIQAPTQEDGGQYRCNAVNSYGESNANIALNFAGKFTCPKPSTVASNFIIPNHVKIHNVFIRGVGKFGGPFDDLSLINGSSWILSNLGSNRNLIFIFRFPPLKCFFN